MIGRSGPDRMCIVRTYASSGWTTAAQREYDQQLEIVVR